MIKFLLDQNGQKIEHEPELRMKGDSRMYLCSCDLCGKNYRFSTNAKLEKKHCSCELDAVDTKTLTVMGETKTLEQWAESDNKVVLSSAKTRYSDRRTGKKTYTDYEVLYGVRSTSKVSIATDTPAHWQEVFVSEFFSRASRHPLMKAIFDSIAVASKSPDFEDTFFKKAALFSKEGLMYESDGTTLSEMLEILGGDVESLKIQLREEDGLNDTQISRLFN
jgi:hypothetical protein